LVAVDVHQGIEREEAEEEEEEGGVATLRRCSSSAMDARMLPRSLIGDV
jgi:hypothetical protein